MIEPFIKCSVVISNMEPIFVIYNLFKVPVYMYSSYDDRYIKIPKEFRNTVKLGKKTKMCGLTKQELLLELL